MILAWASPFKDLNVYMYICCHKDYNETGSESINSQAYHIYLQFKVYW